MLLNIIDEPDRTDHFNGIIPKGIIEICQHKYYLPGLRQGCEAGLESTGKRSEKIQDSVV